VVAGGPHVTQTTVDAVGVDKIREFAALVNQIAPTLGSGPDEMAELDSKSAELQAAASDTPVAYLEDKVLDAQIDEQGEATSR
jgi:hypothetical protein